MPVKTKIEGISGVNKLCYIYPDKVLEYLKEDNQEKPIEDTIEESDDIEEKHWFIRLILKILEFLTNKNT